MAGTVSTQNPAFEFGVYECESQSESVAQPNAGGDVDGGDWHGVLGGFALSGADEDGIMRERR